MQTATRLRADASKCRELASTAVTHEAREILEDMAAEYDQAAMVMEQAGRKPQPAKSAFDWLYA